MSNNIVSSNTTQSTITWTDNGTFTMTSPLWNNGDYIITTVDSDTIGDNWKWKYVSGSVIEPKKGDDNMRYLYEVILVNPKNDSFDRSTVVAKSETSALMKAFYESGFETGAKCVPFDDLKTSCKILMSWEKEKSLNKAIETIKKAVE